MLSAEEVRVMIEQDKYRKSCSNVEKVIAEMIEDHNTHSYVIISSPRLLEELKALGYELELKDDPKNTGTFPLVQRWNINVPSPAENNATAGSSPVNKGTNTVAPNIAIRCWNPNTPLKSPRATFCFFKSLLIPSVNCAICGHSPLNLI